MNVLLLLLAMYGLTFAARSTTLLERPRAWLVSKSTWIRDLLHCSYCTGFHAGYLAYMLGTPLHDWSLGLLILHGFAGAAGSYLLELAALKLEQP